MPTVGFKGRDALLKVSADGGSTFNTVAGIKTNGVTINNEPVDITNAGSGGFKEWLPDGGVQSVSINADGVVNDAAAFKTMLAQAFDRTSVRYKVEFAGSGVIAAEFVLTSFQVTGTYNDAQTFSAQMESDGTVTLTDPT